MIKNVTIGFNTTVDENGIVWTFRSPIGSEGLAGIDQPQQSVSIYNTGNTNTVWVGINEYITNAAVNTGNTTEGADSDNEDFVDSVNKADFNTINAAEALNRGIPCLPGKSVTFRTTYDVNGAKRIYTLWMICSTGQTTDVVGGNVES